MNLQILTKTTLAGNTLYSQSVPPTRETNLTGRQAPSTTL